MSSHSQVWPDKPDSWWLVLSIVCVFITEMSEGNLICKFAAPYSIRPEAFPPS